MELNNAACQLCKRSSSSDCSGVVNGAGSDTARIMVVMDNPTRDDNQRGYYGAGSFGTLLRRILRRAGISEEDVFISGATRCYTGKKPIKTELVKCRDYLAEEIKTVKPEIILSMGTSALHSMVNSYQTTIMKNRGSLRMLEEFGIPLLPTVALGSVWNAPAMEQLITMDFTKARTYLDGWTDPVTTEAFIARSITDANNICGELAESEEFSFDCETTGLDYMSEPSSTHVGAKVLCVSFSNRVGVGYTIPLLGEYCKEIWSPSDYKEIVDILYDILTCGVPKAATNGKFDVKYLWHHLSIPVQNFRADDQLLFAHVNEEKPHSLEHMRTLYTNMERYETFKDDPKYKEELPYWGFSCYPQEKLWEYAAADADCEFRLAQILRPKLVEESRGAGGLFAALRERVPV